MLTDLTLHTGNPAGIDDGMPKTITSNDEWYDSAKITMENLHDPKVGKKFKMIKIHFDDWAKVLAEMDRGINEYEPQHFRWFFSSINDSGEYEQWGSERENGLNEECRGETALDDFRGFVDESYTDEEPKIEEYAGLQQD